MSSIILDEASNSILDEASNFIYDEVGAAMAWPSVYTYNFCSNPSFELDLTGVVAVNGAGILQDPGMWLTGSYSLRVTTPGNVSGEGAWLPPGAVLGSATGAVSFSLQATDVNFSGSLNVYAMDTTSSTTLASTTVTFDNTTSWQRVSISNIGMIGSHNIAVLITTSSIQATSFNIDSVQYEPTLSLNGGNLPTPYIDGDQPFGFWVGTPEESASYKSFQFQLGANGNIQTSGQAGPLLATQVIGSVLTNLGTQPTLVFTDPANGPTQLTGGIDLSGKPFVGLDGAILSGGGSMTVAGATVLLMLAGLNDFAIFQPGDVDPAISNVGFNNTGVATGTNTSGSAGYTRPFATFHAPQAFTGSGTTNIWNTASYFAVGYQFASIAAANAQNISHVQAELVPSNGSTKTPTAYIRPRALTATLAPTQINYCLNPSFQLSTNNWTAVGGTISRDTSTHAPAASDTASGKVVAASAAQGAYTTVGSLIVGEMYTVYAWVSVQATGIGGITVQACGQSATVTPALNAWRQVSLEFTATTSNITVAFFPSTACTFWIDAVMVSPGSGTSTYADGNTAGWTWQSGGVVGESISYYYQRGNIAYAAVKNVLANHLPLGLHAYEPVYELPVTQYS